MKNLIENLTEEQKKEIVEKIMEAASWGQCFCEDCEKRRRTAIERVLSGGEPVWDPE